MKTDIKHLLQTPSLALTLAGLLALGLSLRWPRVNVAAFILLALVGAATVTTLQDEVRRQGREWGWRGLLLSLRRPSRVFWRHMLTHAPQATLALYLAMRWRRKGRRADKG